MNRSKLHTVFLFVIIQMPTFAHSAASYEYKIAGSNVVGFPMLFSEENDEKGARQFLMYHVKKNMQKAEMSILSG